jgi:hypothetical protein
MPKRRIILAVLCTAAVIALLSVVWWYMLLPYPYSVYLEARKASVYSDGWPISEADFLAAKHLVKGNCGFFEVIWSIQVSSPTKLEFQTLTNWTGPLSATGQFYKVEKIEGKWVIVSRFPWMS